MFKKWQQGLWKIFKILANFSIGVSELVVTVASGFNMPPMPFAHWVNLNIIQTVCHFEHLFTFSCVYLLLKMLNAHLTFFYLLRYFRLMGSKTFWQVSEQVRTVGLILIIEWKFSSKIFIKVNWIFVFWWMSYFFLFYETLSRFETCLVLLWNEFSQT